MKCIENTRHTWITTKDPTTVVCVLVTCFTFFATAATEFLLITKALASRRAEYVHGFCLKPGTCGGMPDILHTYLNQTINAGFDRLETDEENNLKTREDTKPIIALKKYLKTAFWTMTPAARVIGDHTVRGRAICGNHILCMSDLQPIQYWIHTGRARDFGVYLRNGIKYQDGRLVVPSSGTYHVYSFLNIHEPIECVRNGTKLHKPPLIHAIHTFNILDGSEREVAARTQLRHDSIGSEDWEYNSYLSSVVELNSGDELTVMFSNVSLLTSPYSNYFGVNLV